MCVAGTIGNSCAKDQGRRKGEKTAGEPDWDSGGFATFGSYLKKRNYYLFESLRRDCEK
jgi:hypothetical protein